MQWAWPPLTITLWPSPFLHNLMVSPVLLTAISLNRKLIRKRQNQVDASPSGSSCYSLVDSTRTRVLAIRLNRKDMFYASVITLWSEAGCLFLAATPRQTDRQIDRRTKSPHNLRNIFHVGSGSEASNWSLQCRDCSTGTIKKINDTLNLRSAFTYVYRSNVLLETVPRFFISRSLLLRLGLLIIKFL